MGVLGRRSLSLAATVAMLIAATVIGASGAGAADPPAGAVLTPSATQGSPGTTVTVGVSGCTGDQGESYRRAVVRLVRTGADPVVVALGESFEDDGVELTLPDWYEPGPGLLTADCIDYSFEDEQSTVVFAYPPIAFDLQAGTAPPRQSMSLGRTSLEEGQVVDVTLTGCDVDDGESATGYVLLFEGDDAMLGFNDAIANANAAPDGSGRVHVELEALSYRGRLEPGSYTVVGICWQDRALTLYRSEPVTITASNAAVDTIQLDRRVAESQVLISGSGCTGGALVTLEITADRWDEMARARRKLEDRISMAAKSQRSAKQLDRLVVTPAADGSWSHLWTEPADGADELSVVAECGDPSADGFRYQRSYLYIGIGDLARVERVSPTSSPVGGPVDVHVFGSCSDPVGVDLLDGEGEAHSSGSAAMENSTGTARLDAPDHAGLYAIRVRCGTKKGMAGTLDVFDPGPPRSPAVVPPGPPATGWPSAGPVEHFTGRIGPIMLPAEDMDPMDPMGTRALPPSGLGVAVPRPEGDFAIRSMKYDLVDAGSNASVPREDAHLHHFVVAKLGDHNPACPNGTFGLPGKIFAAVGQERTPLNLADPYGLVVRAGDAWAGVYDLMNLTDETREVYLTYEMTIQRDISKIRPLNTYFTSATGCSRFTWTVDGSGTKDVQRTYITVEKDGLLVGGGGHVHNGGEATELHDDRDRLLCRAEAHFGEGGHGGHGGHDDMAGASRAAVTETTVSPTTTRPGGGEGDPMFPPEFYPDDPPLEHISNCPGINRPVKAGERLRFDAIYTNDRARSGVMGIALFHVWEGGGPADPVTGGKPNTPPPASPAKPLPGRARFTG
jgi:hypothetical protein